MPKTFIIIPTYNEADNIKKIIHAIFALNITNLYLIIVDDNSPDNTAAIVKNSIFSFPNILLIQRQEKLGLGGAYLAGFKFALDNVADLIFEMDADFSHDPREIPNFIKEINNGFDVVIGSRRVAGGNVQGWNKWRNLMSKIAMRFAKTILNLKTNDVTAGFRCYKKEVLRQIKLDKIKSNGYSFQEEMIFWCEKLNFKIKEIPITFTERENGQSKMSAKEIMAFFITIIKLKFKI